MKSPCNIAMITKLNSRLDELEVKQEERYRRGGDNLICIVTVFERDSRYIAEAASLSSNSSGMWEGEDPTQADTSLS